MPGFSMTSSYKLVTSDPTATLHSLMSSPAEGSSDLGTLSTNNYPVSGSKEPNAANQLVFMNQPLSWWLENLNTGTVKYTPFSNEVNWAYMLDSNTPIHISISISNSLIPNKTQSVETDPITRVSTITLEPKYGLCRTDTHSM
jgi:hypothetical protein